MSAFDGVPFHGEQGRYRCDRDLDAVGAAVGHLAVNGDEPVVAQGEVCAVGALYGEVVDQRWVVPGDCGFARHEEIDDHVDARSVVARGHGTHELEALQVVALGVAVGQEQFDKLSVFAVAEGIGVEREIDVSRADMAHVGVTEQQPRDGPTDHGELAPKSAQELSDFEQHGPDGTGRAVVVVAGVLGFYASHEMCRLARCSAASRSRSLPHQRSR